MMKILVKDQIYFFKDQKIIRFEAQQDKSIMHLSNGKCQTLDIPIENIEKQLIYTGFIRVHPEHILNVDYISKIPESGACIIELEGGIEIPSSDNTTARIIQLLENHMNQ